MKKGSVADRPSGMIERTALMSRDMIGLIALDFVLRIVLGSVMGMSFIVEIAHMNLDDLSRYVASLGIPAHVIADLELL